MSSSWVQRFVSYRANREKNSDRNNTVRRYRADSDKWSSSLSDFTLLRCWVVYWQRRAAAVVAISTKRQGPVRMSRCNAFPGRTTAWWITCPHANLRQHSLIYSVAYCRQLSFYDLLHLLPPSVLVPTLRTEVEQLLIFIASLNSNAQW